MAWWELLRLCQGHVAIRVEQADGVVKVVEIDDQLVEDALVVLDLAGDLPALLDQPGQRIGAFYHARILAESGGWPYIWRGVFAT